MKRIDLKNLNEYILDKGFIINDYCYKCRKISYRSIEDAKNVASQIMSEGKGHSYSYFCPRGCGIHLTSMKPQSIRCTKLRKQNKTQSLKHLVIK